MKFVRKLALLISTLFLLNSCDAQTLNDINSALNNYNGTSYGQSYQQQPVYVQPQPKRCTTTYNSFVGGYITNCW